MERVKVLLWSTKYKNTFTFILFLATTITCLLRFFPFEVPHACRPPLISTKPFLDLTSMPFIFSSILPWPPPPLSSIPASGLASEPSSLFKIMKLGLITKDSPCLLQDAGRRRRRGSTTRGRKTTACSTRDRTRRTPPPASLMTAALSGSFAAAVRTLAITARRRVRRTRRTDMRKRRRRRTRTMRTRSASRSRRICPLSVSPRTSRRMRRDSFDPIVSRKHDISQNVLSFSFLC
jgi:hypothetical protein